MSIFILQNHLNIIMTHIQESFPYCVGGFLGGQISGNSKSILGVFPTKKLLDESNENSGF